MNVREREFYQLTLDTIYIPQRVVDRHEQVSALLKKTGHRISCDLMAYIAATEGQVRDYQPTEFQKGESVSVPLGHGTFVCYWKDKARVRIIGDEAPFRVVELSEIERV